MVEIWVRIGENGLRIYQNRQQESLSKAMAEHLDDCDNPDKPP